MNDRAWRVTAVSLLTGFMIGMPGVGQAADGDYDDPALAGLFEGAPAHPDRHNDFGRTALNVQLRVIELDAAGDTVSTVIGPTLERVPGQGRVHFNVQVPDHRRSYRVAVGSFSFDFADPAAR
jgi:hypothetical protein